MEDAIVEIALRFALICCGVVIAFGFYELNKACRDLVNLNRAIRGEDPEARDE